MQQNGVNTLVIFQGVNDIGGSRHVEQTTTQLIAAYENFIKQARAKGMKVYLATITPFKGNGYFTYFHESARQYVNDWIRHCDHVDGIVDFDQLVRDPADPAKIQEIYSDDWLHLNPAGYEAMGKYAATIIR
jgi:lysophospholipase L1-like esterase